MGKNGEPWTLSGDGLEIEGSHKARLPDGQLHTLMIATARHDMCPELTLWQHDTGAAERCLERAMICVNACADITNPAAIHEAIVVLRGVQKCAMDDVRKGIASSRVYVDATTAALANLDKEQS